ncbi:hypothetical protein [Candidatus Nitrosoglobus terrae]|uniref:hypothetical protein n=1 Tax=Candidatus Nitrosoglobus terrae TaxID=1630141 RepID=UPI001E447FB4|nr:hypothetical protein [Candidatus Nitrosoglobus terrae]
MIRSGAVALSSPIQQSKRAPMLVIGYPAVIAILMLGGVQTLHPCGVPTAYIHDIWQRMAT